MRAPRLMAPEDMTKTMNVGLLDSLVLREHLQLGVDVVLAHRLAEGEPLHGDPGGRVQDLIAARVRAALSHMDEAQMPFNWSWEQAAERLSFEVAMEISREYRGRWNEL